MGDRFHVLQKHIAKPLSEDEALAIVQKQVDTLMINAGGWTLSLTLHLSL